MVLAGRLSARAADAELNGLMREEPFGPGSVGAFGLGSARFCDRHTPQIRRATTSGDSADAHCPPPSPSLGLASAKAMAAAAAGLRKRPLWVHNRYSSELATPTCSVSPPTCHARTEAVGVTAPHRLTPTSALAHLRTLTAAKHEDPSTLGGHFWRLGSTLWHRADAVRLRRQLWKWRYFATRSRPLLRRAVLLSLRIAVRRLWKHAAIALGFVCRGAKALYLRRRRVTKRVLRTWASWLEIETTARAYRFSADFASRGRARRLAAEYLVTWQLRATARAQEAARESSSRAVSVRSALRVWRLRLPRLAVVRSSRQLAAQRRLFAAWALWVASCLQLQRNADTLKAWRGNVSHEVRFNATHRFLWMCIAHRLEWGWARWVTSSAVIRQVGAWHNAIRLAALGRALERWRARATAEMVVDGPGDMRGLLWL